MEDPSSKEVCPGKIEQSEPVCLKRSVGLWNAVAIIMGVIIGSGIFISPSPVLQQANNMGAALLVWGLCGIITLMGSLCMAELGTSVGDSGGDYTYLKLAYGPCIAFLYLWVTMFIILPCSNAVAALTFANYVLKPFYINCDPPSESVRLVALVIVLILVWINCRSIQWSIMLQSSFTLLKVIALMVIITFGLYQMLSGQSVNTMDKIWMDKKVEFWGVANAFYCAIYSYGGWNALNFITEEVKNPVKNMPKAIIISITSITVIYILINMSFFAVLNHTEITTSPAIAVLFGQKTLGAASILMPLSVGLSTTSGLNALIFSSSRILLVGARQGQLHSLLNMINVRYMTPIPSLLIVGLTSCLYLTSVHILSLVNYLIFIEASFQVLAVSTVLVLRRKFPQMPRPLRVNTIVVIIFLILSSFMIITPVYSNPYEALIGTSILLLGIPIYYLTAIRKTQSSLYTRLSKKLTFFIQNITTSVEPDSNEADIYEGSKNA